LRCAAALSYWFNGARHGWPDGTLLQVIVRSKHIIGKRSSLGRGSH
jgi:hypothetical protein